MESIRHLVRLRGHVTLQKVRAGTGSEHGGLVLTTSKGQRLLLVKLGSNPFEASGPAGLDGAEVEAEGYVVGAELRYVNLHPVGGQKR